jgi:hypothetical protein
MFSPLIALGFTVFCGAGIVLVNCSLKTPVMFTLTSRRNHTGHWIAEASAWLHTFLVI